MGMCSERPWRHAQAAAARPRCRPDGKGGGWKGRSWSREQENQVQPLQRQRQMPQGPLRGGRGRGDHFSRVTLARVAVQDPHTRSRAGRRASPFAIPARPQLMGPLTALPPAAAAAGAARAAAPLPRRRLRVKRGNRPFLLRGACPSAWTPHGQPGRARQRAARMHSPRAQRQRGCRPPWPLGTTNTLLWCAHPRGLAAVAEIAGRPWSGTAAARVPRWAMHRLAQSRATPASRRAACSRALAAHCCAAVRR